MKGWITAVLAVTFLSGTSTGFLFGISATPEAPPTWIDRNIEHLQSLGVTDQEGLDLARSIYEEHERKIRDLRQQIDKIFGDPIRTVEDDTARRITELMRSRGVELRQR